MKKLILFFLIAVSPGVVSETRATKPDVPSCSTDANGKKYCCVATGMGGYCYYP